MAKIYYCPCCDSGVPLIESEEYICESCGVSVPREDAKSLRTTKEVYHCPFDETILSYTGNSKEFKCPGCNRIITIQEFKPKYKPEKKPEDTACLVCGSTLGVNANKLLYEEEVFGGAKQGYFHDKCHTKWKEQIANDRVIMDWQISIQDLLPKINCPFCGENKVITLQPWVPTHCVWQCDNCEMVIGENYVYDELNKLGAEILKCRYCGEQISMALGHDCLKVSRVYLRK